MSEMKVLHDADDGALLTGPTRPDGFADCLLRLPAERLHRALVQHDGLGAIGAGRRRVIASRGELHLERVEVSAIDG